jgi:hypothetical protein
MTRSQQLLAQFKPMTSNAADLLYGEDGGAGIEESGRKRPSPRADLEHDVPLLVHLRVQHVVLAEGFAGDVAAAGVEGADGGVVAVGDTGGGGHDGGRPAPDAV